MKFKAVNKFTFCWSNSKFGGAGMVTVLHLPYPTPFYWLVSHGGVTLSRGWLYQKWRSLDIPDICKPSLTKVVFKINDVIIIIVYFQIINIIQKKNKNNITIISHVD